MHYGPVPDGFVPDHKDRNPINNRLQNLRLATQDQNAQNATRRKDNLLGLKGVTYNKVTQKYAARIQANGVLMSLGHHPTKGMAAVARAKAAIRYHGPFAVLF